MEFQTVFVISLIVSKSSYFYVFRVFLYVFGGVFCMSLECFDIIYTVANTCDVLSYLLLLITVHTE